MASISDSVTNFAVRFCNELDSNKNFICSPLSVETLLALVALSSSNDTRAELLTALDIPNEHALRSTFKSLTRNLDLGTFSIHHPRSWITSMCQSVNKCNVTLKIANKIYVKKGKAVKSNIKKDAVKVFKSSLEQIDFSKSSDAANTINAWVASQTKNIIKEIVCPTMFNQDTGLVLVNAIYFHGLWQFPFKARDTWPGSFHVNSTTAVQMSMMSMEGESFNFKHSPELQAKILQMFYQGGEASMVIVLPDKIEGLSEVVQLLAASYDLMKDIKSLEKTPLQVVIPKFKVETEIDLKELLPKMGVKKIFDYNESDISMLSSNESLYVSEAIQKAYINVDEAGTEAAAATQLRWRKLCAHFWMGETFIANQPYLYLLMARGVPIFFGNFQGKKNRVE